MKEVINLVVLLASGATFVWCIREIRRLYKEE